MTILDRFSLSAAIFVVAALGATGANVAALLGPQSELWQLPETLTRMQAWQAKIKEFDKQHRTLVRLLAARTEIFDRLTRGELTLLEAVERMHELDRERPCRFRPVPAPVAGSTEQERDCRRLIERVRLALSDRKPAYVSSVCGRLEAELRRTFSPEPACRHIH
jgi:hypothetical protein